MFHPKHSGKELPLFVGPKVLCFCLHQGTDPTEKHRDFSPSQKVWVLSYRQSHGFESLLPKLLNVSVAIDTTVIQKVDVTPRLEISL